MARVTSGSREPWRLLYLFNEYAQSNIEPLEITRLRPQLLVHCAGARRCVHDRRLGVKLQHETNHAGVEKKSSNKAGVSSRTIVIAALTASVVAPTPGLAG
jgi:hypothetical protein